jgi:hypothetical protein
VSPGTIVLIILVLCLVGVFPAWPYSADWGYYPAGGLGLLLIVVIVLLLTGRIWPDTGATIAGASQGPR